jgi:hypothetical protein
LVSPRTTQARRDSLRSSRAGTIPSGLASSNLLIPNDRNLNHQNQYTLLDYWTMIRNSSVLAKNPDRML